MATRSPQKNWYHHCLVLLILAVLPLAGCSAKGQVSGQVTYKGTPLASGRITLLQEDGGKQQFFTAPVKDGAYTIRGLTSGPVKVRIETSRPVQVNLEKAKAKGIQLAPQSAASLGNAMQIPPRYGQFKTSGLDFEVSGGSQRQDFDLKP
jgi:hypothetical protein